MLLFLCAAVAAPLTAQTPVWTAVTGGAPPALATPVGLTPEGTVLFLARAIKGGVASLGWLDPRSSRATVLEGGAAAGVPGGATAAVSSSGMSYVAVGPAGVAWALDPSDRVFHWTGTDWLEPTPGALLRQISVGDDGTVWGVNREGMVWRFAGNTWVRLPGTFTQVSVGSAGVIWGLNAQGGIFRWDGNGWARVEGGLKQVDVAADGTVWGVNAADQVWRHTGSSWVAVPPGPVQASVGGADQVWGVAADDRILRWAGNRWVVVEGLLRQIDVSSDGTVMGVNGAGQVWRYTGMGWQEVLPGTALATTPGWEAPAPLKDRPGTPIRIQPYFGNAEVSGQIDTADAIRNGVYTDTYVYEANAGEQLFIFVWPTEESANVRPEVIAPNGRTVPSNDEVSPGWAYEVIATRAGVFTIHLASSDVATGSYYRFSLEGPGQVIRGDLDPFSDSRDAGFLYDTVDLDVQREGYHRITLEAKDFRMPRLILRDSDYRDLAVDDGSVVHEAAPEGALMVWAAIAPGSYHVIIEDESLGGDWTLTIDYEGPSGGS